MWETERSTYQTWDPAWDDGTAAAGLTWAQHIYTALTAANVSAFLYWWGSSTPTIEGDNESLIQIKPSVTDSSSDAVAQAGIPIRDGSLTATLPARSLVTFDIR